MKNFSIPKPCSENWSEMTPTQKGAFCQKCALEVNDVSEMTNRQIRSLFHENLGKRTCVRMTVDQETSMNDDFIQWQLSNKANMQRAMVFSLLVVFGLSLFSCNNPQQVRELQDLQNFAASVMPITDNVDSDTSSMTKTIDATTIDDSQQIIQSVPHDYRLGQMVEFVPNERFTKGELIETPIDPPVEQRVMMAGEPMMIPDFENFIIEEVETPVNGQFAENERGNSLTFSAIAFPNPVVSTTLLEVTIPEHTKHLEITLMDLSGKVLKKVSNTKADAGSHSFEIAMQALKPAVYLVDVRYNDAHEVVRIVKVD